MPRPFQLKRYAKIDLSKGINREGSFLTGKGTLWDAVNVILGDGYPGVKVSRLPSQIDYRLTNIDELKKVYRSTGEGMIYYRTGSGGAIGNSPITLPAISGRFSSAVFRGYLIVATEGQITYAFTLDDSPPTQTAMYVTGSSTRLCPQGGLVASFKNRVWISGCNQSIERPAITIPLSVVGVPVTGTSIKILPEALDFGMVRTLTESSPRNVFIFNNGQSPVKIVGVTAKGNDFTITRLPNLPLKLLGGQSASFEVTFTPEERGKREGSLIVTTDMATEFEGGNWTATGSVVTVSETLTANAYQTGYYLHLVSGTGTADYPIVANTTNTITVEGTISLGSGTKYYIKHAPTFKIDLKGEGTSLIFLPSPSVADFGEWMLNASTNVKQEILITLSNPFNDTLTFIPTSNWTITSDTGVTFSISQYKINDGDWVNGTPIDYLYLEGKKSLILKLKAVITQAGAKAGTLTVKSRQGINPNRLYFSEAIDHLTWDIDNNWIDFVDQKGEAGEVMALVPYADMLWVFTENTAFAVTGNSPESFRRQEIPLCKGVGIIGTRAWAVEGGILYWISSKGIYAAAGTSVQKISAPLGQDIGQNFNKDSQVAGNNGYVVFASPNKQSYLYKPGRGFTRIGSMRAVAGEEGGDNTGTILFCDSNGLQRMWQSTTGGQAVYLETNWDGLGDPTILKRIQRITLIADNFSAIPALEVTTDKNLNFAGYPLTPLYTPPTADYQGTGYLDYIFEPDVIGNTFRIAIDADSPNYFPPDTIIYGLIVYWQPISDIGMVT